jgi:hypothetical protein
MRPLSCSCCASPWPAACSARPSWSRSPGEGLAGGGPHYCAPTQRAWGLRNCLRLLCT